MSVKERLISYLKYKNVSQNRFEKACGLSNGYVNNIKQSISPNKIQLIARQFPELNTGWLLTGEGEMLKPAKNNFTQFTPEEIGDIIAEKVTAHLLKMYADGEIFSADGVRKMMAEKDARIEELQKRIWELEKLRKDE